MIKAAIIEDERHASEYLVSLLKDAHPQISVEALLSTAAESIDFFKHNKVDLIFSDVQLPDGLSFYIFDELSINTPVIFTTGYDRFVLEAFEYNGIDYLIKPVEPTELKRAIEKYKKLEQHFAYNDSLIASMLHKINGKRREKLFIRKSTETFALHLSDIILFFTQSKLVYALDKNFKKHLLDKNLSDLESELDSDRFFRANRQFIVNSDYIKGFRTYERVKLQVELNVDIPFNNTIIVSQETAASFRQWLYEA